MLYVYKNVAISRSMWDFSHVGSRYFTKKFDCIRIFCGRTTFWRTYLVRRLSLSMENILLRSYIFTNNHYGGTVENNRFKCIYVNLFFSYLFKFKMEFYENHENFQFGIFFTRLRYLLNHTLRKHTEIGVYRSVSYMISRGILYQWK